MRRISRMIIVLGLLLGALGGLRVHSAEATSWGDCTWTAHTPHETADHYLTGAVDFACDTYGNRTLKGELWLIIDNGNDVFLARRTVTYYNTKSGGFYVTYTTCSNSSYLIPYKTRAWMINPDTGNQSSGHSIDNYNVSLECHS